MRRLWVGWKAGRLTNFVGYHCPGKKREWDWLPCAIGIFALLLFVVGCTAICRATDAKHKPSIEHYDTIEFNTYGQGDPPPTCALFRDEAGFIQAWRYGKQIGEPTKLHDGRYWFIWEEHGVTKECTCDHIRMTRTDEDVEMVDRSRLVPWQPRTGLFTPSILRRVLWSDVPFDAWVKGAQETWPLRIEVPAD